jgi:L-threonylcarbamoyladenylate synthase
VAATIRPDHILPVDPVKLQWDRIRLAAAAIRRGEVLAIPTDTVYGLAGDPFRPGVAEQIFRMKRRRESQPILLLIADFAQLDSVARETPLLGRLAAAFWPGPLTVILPARENVPAAITAGTGTIAVRLPAAKITRALIRAAGVPLTGTSANLSGRPPAQTASEVNLQLGHCVYYLLDAGRTRRSTPSTIVDLSGPPRIVRAGAIPEGRLRRFLR